MITPVLDAREERWNRRRTLAGSLPVGWSVVSFTLRMPALLRLGGQFDSVAAALFADLLRFLEVKGLEIRSDGFTVRADGPEGGCSVRGDWETVKKRTVEFEEKHPWGDLADVDVMNAEGKEIGRSDLAFSPRKCLVCGGRAAECVVGRNHEIDEIRRKVEEILLRPAEFFKEDALPLVGLWARAAVLYEAAAAPKPGLVDPVSQGAHGDMDYFTFLTSAAALAPWWENFARLGWRHGGDDPAALFPSLRKEGLRAEKAMFDATGGVNTHKGLIFSLGVLCASAGMLLAEGKTLSPESCAAQGALIVWGIVEKDFAGLGAGEKSDEKRLTAGERFYLREKITGIRGEAERGFPSVLNAGLPGLRSGLGKGLSLNDAMIDALLALLTTVEDTNILLRGGREGHRIVKEAARKTLDLGGMVSEKGKKAVLEMDALFSKKNLSPGGSADLLAVTVFLHFLYSSQRMISSKNV